MIKMKSFIFFLVLLLFFGLIASMAVAQDGKYGGTLTIAYPADLVTFDVMVTTAEPNEPRFLIFEPLFIANAELEPKPILAESWKLSDDELTWTIKIRQDVKFHDGQSMTSADVVASWNRYRKVGVTSWMFDRVDHILATDDYTVEFHLKEPFGAFIESLGGTAGVMSVYPKWVVDEVGEEWVMKEEHLIGTGPYKIKEIMPGERYVVERNENYSQPVGEPSFLAGKRYSYPDVLDFRYIEDPATRVAALIAGDVDIINKVPLDDAKRVDSHPDTYVTVNKPGFRPYFKFNSTQGPFADLVLRRAVRAALDPEKLLSTIGDSDYWRINHAVRFQEEQWGWTDVASMYFPNNMELGKYLVKQSSYDGEPIRILASPGRQPEYRTVIVLQELLRDLGLNAELVVVDVATYVQKRKQLDQWEIKATGGGPGGPISLMFSIRNRVGEEWPGVAPEWHYYMDKIITSADREVRANAIHELNRLHSEACHEMWIGDVFSAVGSRSYVKNVPIWPGPAMWNIWLDK